LPSAMRRSALSIAAAPACLPRLESHPNTRGFYALDSNRRRV
jgi:hypothetical protein